MKTFREILEQREHNNPYVGSIFDDRILRFDVPGHTFIWIGSKWLEDFKITKIRNHVYAQKDAALELIRKAVPKLKKQTNMQKYLQHMRGWE